MLKQVALATILGLTLAGSVASAQGVPGRARQGVGLPRAQRAMQGLHRRVTRGVRAGRITTEERQALRAQFQAMRAQLRADLQARRQTGVRPTADERRQVRQALRQMNRAVMLANRNGRR